MTEKAAQSVAVPPVSIRPGLGRALFDSMVQVYLLAGVVLSVCLLVYTLVHWRIALPSFDVVDYHAFLAQAIEGQLDWHELWQRHNLVHLIPWPKLLWVLDLRWVDGQGWLVSVASALAVLCTCLIVCQQLRIAVGLSRVERQLFIGLVCLFLGSVLMAECLLSPVNCQWSWQALGVVMLARGLQGVWCEQQKSGIGWMLSGALLAWLNAAPFSVLLPSVLLPWLLLSASDMEKMRFRLLSVLAVLSVLLVLWECLAWRSGQPLLLSWLYQQWVAPADRSQVDAFIRADGTLYAGWLLDRAVFMGRFLLLTLGKHWQPVWCLAVVWVLVCAALLWSVARWMRGTVFWVCLFVFGLLMGGGAAVLRYATLYDYRHANVGFLLGFSALILVYASVSWLQRVRLLQCAVLMYVPLFLYAMGNEAGSWAWEGSNQIREQQIGAAVGVQDAAMFAYVWKHDPTRVAEVEQHRDVFRTHHKGIYATRAYRLFAGELSLPTVEVTCDYTQLDVRQHAPDPLAFRVRGATKTGDGQVLSQALFLDAQGKPVGWALQQLPSDNLLQQWTEPSHWGGHLKLRALTDSTAQAVDIVAFDNSQRCQPHRIMLSAAGLSAARSVEKALK